MIDTVIKSLQYFSTCKKIKEKNPYNLFSSTRLKCNKFLKEIINWNSLKFKRIRRQAKNDQTKSKSFADKVAKDI